MKRMLLLSAALVVSTWAVAQTHRPRPMGTERPVIMRMPADTNQPAHRAPERPERTDMKHKPHPKQAPKTDPRPVAKADATPHKKHHKASRPQQVRITPYGFVRNYFDFDSRATYTVVGGEYNIIPYDEDWNLSESDAQYVGAERADLNAVPNARFQAISTRIGLDLHGPQVLGMHSSGKVEGDFGGFGTNNTVFRIRQAYVQLSKTDTILSTSVVDSTVRKSALYRELLVGQTWHPLGGDIMPEVVGMAAGSPFRPHSRTPQVRGLVQNGNWNFTLALLYQVQYMNNGPQWNGTSWTSTNSTSYALNAIVPEVFLGVGYRDKHIYTQLGADLQTLRPRTFGIMPYNGQDVRVRVKENVISFTPTLYFQYTEDKFALKCRTLLASNTSHLNQLVGYGVTGVSPDGSWEYSPLRASISYLNIAYGKKYRFNLFLGYMKNLGASADLYNFGSSAADPLYYIYLKGDDNFTHLNSLYRFAPSISYNVKAFNLGLEYEFTAATYGDWNSNGSIANNSNLHQVVNHRICALVKYNF